MKLNLIIRDEAGSTQDLARDLAINGAEEGTSVLALSQTGGRGRSGRPWISPPGKNVALSMILRPEMAPQNVPLLGLMAAVATAETVQAKGVGNVQLKWPNDVMAAGRKVAGILSEASISAGSAEFVIIGIGLNVNTEESDFPPTLRTPATSIFILTGREWDVVEIARDLVGNMGSLYERVVKEGCGFIPELWEAWWPHRGRPLVHEGVVGHGLGLDQDGALMMKTEQGTVKRIVSGEVLPLEREA